MCIIVPMNTQHTEPPSWLFTSYNTLRQQVHLSYSSIRNTRPDTRSFSRTAEDTTLMRKACFVLFFEGTHELKWLKYRKWLPRRTPLFSVHDCLCGWDHYPLSLRNTACARLSLSMSGVHQGEAIPLLIVGSWLRTCHETHRATAW